MLQRYYKKWMLIVAIPAWVAIGFYIAQMITLGLIWVITRFVSLELINEAVLNSTISAFVYLITTLIVIGLPWIITKYKTTRAEIGLTELPLWTDIFLAPASFIIYIIISAILILIATKFLPGFDINQVQDIGYRQISKNYEYILAFVSLIVIVPIIEEILFRGFLFGKLKKIIPVWAAIIITSVLFGFLHGSWNVGIDTFALSVVLCLLRQFTGSIWASILLHMLKNSIAFYFLFINSSIFDTIIR